MFKRVDASLPEAHSSGCPDGVKPVCEPAPASVCWPPVSVPVSVVIPAYNEQRRLPRALLRIDEYARRIGQKWEIIVVNDGSIDATSRVAHEALHGGGTVIENQRNRGKGFSVRRGMLAATGERLLQCDADLSTPIEEFERLNTHLDEGADIAIASRDMPGARLDPPQGAPRRWMAMGFRAVRRRLLLPGIRDTQCGFKLFRRDAARDIFERVREDGFLFDCEVLAWAERLGYRVQETPVTWRNDADSRVNIAAEGLRAIPALLRIRRRLRNAQ